MFSVCLFVSLSVVCQCCTAGFIALCTLPSASKPEPDSPQSSRLDTAVSSPVRDERPSAMACSVGAQYIKLESEGHEVEKQGASQLKEDDSVSLEASKKVTCIIFVGL